MRIQNCFGKKFLKIFIQDNYLKSFMLNFQVIFVI